MKKIYIITEKIVIGIYILTLVILNFIRIFDNNFWADECYSIRLAKMNFLDMLQATAMDVHPPLYYAILQCICRIFDYNIVAYRLTSFIPYGMVILFSLFVVWKKFSKGTAIILISFASLLDTAIMYNVQVRMYEWGGVFVLFSFYFLHEILVNDKASDYIGYVFMSLCAAYTQYYCLISVAFFYIILLIVAVIKKGKFLYRVLFIDLVTVILYLPWFFVLLSTFQRTSQNYWMEEIPTIKACLLDIFDSKYRIIFLIAFFLVMLFLFINEIEVINKAITEKHIQFHLANFTELEINNLVWEIAALLSIFGTILVGIVVSKLFRPMFTTRYIYPVSVVAWFMFGIGVSKFKRKKICIIILVALILWGGIPEYIKVYNLQEEQKYRVEQTLEATRGRISTDDIILTDSALLSWTILEYYYPHTSHILIDINDFSDFEKDTQYWLVTESEMDNSVATFLKKQNYESINIVNNSILGTHTVYIYKLNFVN